MSAVAAKHTLTPRSTEEIGPLMLILECVFLASVPVWAVGLIVITVVLVAMVKPRSIVRPYNGLPYSGLEFRTDVFVTSELAEYYMNLRNRLAELTRWKNTSNAQSPTTPSSISSGSLKLWAYDQRRRALVTSGIGLYFALGLWLCEGAIYAIKNDDLFDYNRGGSWTAPHWWGSVNHTIGYIIVPIVLALLVLVRVVGAKGETVRKALAYRIAKEEHDSRNAQLTDIKVELERLDRGISQLRELSTFYATTGPSGV